MDTRSSPRGGSPLLMVPNKSKHVETSSASEEDDERKKWKRKMKRSDKRGEEEEKTTNVRDRSRSIDSGMASKLTKKKKKSADIKKNESDERTKKTNKKKKGGAVSVSTSPVVREGRSMSMWEGGAPPSALVLHEDDEDGEDANREGQEVNIKTKKSSSVRNALTCFIPLGGDEGSKKVAETSGKDKKKLAAEILIASMDSADSLDEVDEQKSEEKGEAEGGRKKGKHKRKSGGKTESEPPSSPHTSSSSTSLTSSSSAPVHRLGAGMGFNKKQKSPQLWALEDMEHSSELPGGSMPPASSNDSGDGKPETSGSPSPLRLSQKNTLNQKMRSSSDRFSYNSKHQRNSSDGDVKRIITPTKPSKKDRMKERKSGDIGSYKKRDLLENGASWLEEEEKRKKAGTSKKSKEKKKDRDANHPPAMSPTRRVLVSSISWRNKKPVHAHTQPTLPIQSHVSEEGGGRSAIVISPRKPKLVFPESQKRLSFSGWLSHFNGDAHGAERPKRRYQEGTVEGFLEDIQLEEHIHELVQVRGVKTLEQLSEVTAEQFYDMDIPTSDLKILMEEVKKRKSASPPDAHQSQEDKDMDSVGHGFMSEGTSREASEHESENRDQSGGVHSSDESKKTRQALEQVRLLEQKLKEQSDRLAEAERGRQDALHALELEKQKTRDLERKLDEATARIHVMEQSMAAAAAVILEPKRTKTKKKKRQSELSPRAKGDRKKSDKENEDKRENDKEAKDESKPDSKEDRPEKINPSEQTNKGEGVAKQDGQAPADGIVHHYPLQIRVPANRLSRRLSVKMSPRGSSSRAGAALGSENRIRQAEKESFEQKQNDIRNWIESATGEAFSSPDFFESIRSGVLLCKLLNVIAPGTIKNVHVANMAFYQMENLSYFVQGCRKLGVKTIFEPADLYHAKNLEAVLSCLDALDRWARRSGAFKGPFLVRSNPNSQFIRSLSGKLMLDKDTIVKKDSSSASSSAD